MEFWKEIGKIKCKEAFHSQIWELKNKCSKATIFKWYPKIKIKKNKDLKKLQ